MKRVLGHGRIVRQDLAAFLRDRRGAGRWQNDLSGRLAPFMTAGKSLRGGLLRFSYEAFSGRPVNQAVADAAMALELAHGALLIHDDVMDGDATRRGRPALREQYRALAESEGLAQPDHFGDSLAITAGDAVLFLTLELLAGVPAEARRLFTAQLLTTCAGQMQDIYLESRPAPASKEEIYGLMGMKTASYTLALPLTMGAALAGQPPRTIRQLDAVGRDAGIIFQIRDDELGALGDSRATGKPVGSDIREGKKTLLRHHLFEQCDDAERVRLRTIFGNPDVGPADIAYVQELIVERGVRKLLDDEIRRLERRAARGIDRLDLAAADKGELVSLARFCAERKT